MSFRDSDRERHFDVVVAGAGPAGSSLALELARAGRSVLIVEKERFPRDKVCGDFVSPRGLCLLERLGCLDAVLARAGCRIRSSFVHVDGQRLVGGSMPAVAGLPDFGIALPRREFDEILFRQARAAGAQALEGAKLTGFRAEADAVRIQLRLDGEAREYRARVLVGADGAQSVVARLLEAAGGNGRESGAAAAPDVMPTLRCYVEGLEFQHGHFFFERDFFPGFGWVFPIDARRANVGVGASKRVLVKEGKSVHVFFERLKARLANAAREIGASVSFGKERGFPIAVHAGPRRYSASRVVLIGEAARLVDPISGEGIALALESARLAVPVLASGFERDDFSAELLSAYDAALERRFQAELGVADMVATAVKNRALLKLWLFAFRFMGSTARRDETYAETMGGILAGLIPHWKAFTPELFGRALVNLPVFLGEELGALARSGPDGALRAGQELLSFPAELAASVARDPASFLAWNAELEAKRRIAFSARRS